MVGIGRTEFSSCSILPLKKLPFSSDLFVGCYGRRYGSRHNMANVQTHWVGTSLDRAAGQYPWLAHWRDRGITELEYR